VKTGAWWPIALVGVLGVTVAANGVLLWEARGPGAAAVEPDYYRKAVAWDSTLAQRRRSDALGWRLDAALGTPGPGGAVLKLRLEDREGVPVRGVEFRIEAIHNLEAGHRVEAALGAPDHPALPDPTGSYEIRLPIHRQGLWELRVEARRRSDRFFASLRREAGEGFRP